jgi:hypothetical protein
MFTDVYVVVLDSIFICVVVTAFYQFCWPLIRCSMFDGETRTFTIPDEVVERHESIRDAKRELDAEFRVDPRDYDPVTRPLPRKTIWLRVAKWLVS